MRKIENIITAFQLCIIDHWINSKCNRTHTRRNKGLPEQPSAAPRIPIDCCRLAH